MSSPKEVADTSETPKTSSDFSSDRESVAVEVSYITPNLTSPEQARTSKTDVDPMEGVQQQPLR